MRKFIYFFAKRAKRNTMIKSVSSIFLNNQELKNIPCEGEDAFIAKWRVLDKDVSPLSYRLYSKYIGPQSEIVPPETARLYIEPILNSCEYENFYADKNSFGLFIDPLDMPKTLFRSMGYKLYDGEYNAVTPKNFDNCFDSFDKVIVKPAKDLGGHGIMFFERRNGILVNKDNSPLTIQLLEKIYKTDFLIQECFVQGDYIAQFNPTSVNTIRVNTYRDVKTGEIHILGAAIRIGAKGAVVDNLTSGGAFVGINNEGQLGPCVYDKFGRSTTIYNDIDFSKSTFTIPNFETVKEFAIKISKRLPHMRLFALDIVLDQTNTPKLIEVNSNNFSVKFLQLTKQPAFGKYTDEIIEYCIKHKEYLSVGFHQTLRK